jgi:hypothetical protein
MKILPKGKIKRNARETQLRNEIERTKGRVHGQQLDDDVVLVTLVLVPNHIYLCFYCIPVSLSLSHWIITRVALICARLLFWEHI